MQNIEHLQVGRAQQCVRQPPEVRARPQQCNRLGANSSAPCPAVPPAGPLTGLHQARQAHPFTWRRLPPYRWSRRGCQTQKISLQR